MPAVAPNDWSDLDTPPAAVQTAQGERVAYLGAAVTPDNRRALLRPWRRRDSTQTLERRAALEINPLIVHAKGLGAPPSTC
jgi:hypothetical protein